MLPPSAGMESLYITDGTGNPTALIAAGNYVSVAYSYDPYGVQTITKDAGGNATDQTRTPSNAGSRTAPLAGSVTAPAGTTPPPAAGPNKTPKTHPWTPPTPTATPTLGTTPSTTPIPPDIATEVAWQKTRLVVFLEVLQQDSSAVCLPLFWGPEAPIINVELATLIGAVKVGIATTIKGLIACE